MIDLDIRTMIRRLNCPICEKELPLEINGESALFPFCSIRCKQADLYRWISGDYAIVDDLTPDKMFEHFSREDHSQEPQD